MICLLAGVGATALIARLRRPSLRRGAFRMLLGLLVVDGLILLVWTVAHPYKILYDVHSREFARWFWTEQARDAQLVCVKSDLKVAPNRRHWHFFRSSLYLCNRAIYSPDKRRNGVVDWGAIASDRPLRCVVYNEEPRGNPIFREWLRAMDARYQLRASKTFNVNEGVNWRGADYEDRYVVLDFVPRPAPAPSTGSARGREPGQDGAGSPSASISSSTARQSAARVSSLGSPAPNVSIEVR
jgi:hypothetical protein